MENEAELWTALRQVYDPKVDISIVDLGLIYRVVQRDDCAYVELEDAVTTYSLPREQFLADLAQAASERTGSSNDRPHLPQEI